MSGLPKGWAETTLAQLVSPDRPRELPRDLPHLPFVGMEHVEAHSMRLLGTVPASSLKSSAVHFQAGDVLYGRLRPYLNKVLLARFEGLCSAEFIVFGKRAEVSSEWLAYFLNSSAFVSFSSHLNAGDRPRVDFDQIGTYELLVAPRPEQDRIVNEIEKQFTRLDAATVALKRVQVNLKRYRASVLKAACGGRLVPTEAELARKEGRDYEPADKLLQRVLRERRARWEADTLAKMQASGKPPKDDHWKQKYKEPSAPELSMLPEQSEGWAWATVEQLSTAKDGMVTGPFGTLIGKSDQRELGVPVVGIPNITKAGFVPGNWFYLDQSKATELKRYEINPSDIVISRSGTVGEACVIGADHGPLIMSTNLMRIRTQPLAGLTDWVVVNLKGSGTITAQLQDLCKGSTRPFLNLTILSGLLISLPPEAEQARIFSELSRMLTEIDHLDAILIYQMSRVPRLRQAILSQAFTGQLVPQDSTDEPATVLLERIRAERSASATQKPARRSRKEAAHA